MYTASVFMALISALQVSYDEGEELGGEEIGFLSYGSGSKSKVFSGKIAEKWKDVASKWNLFETLAGRKAISFETYEKLHLKQLKEPINPNYKGFGLLAIEKENPVKIGARYYDFK